MTISEEQLKNGYPVEAIKFLMDSEKYLSDEVDEYGLKKCKPDSFKLFSKYGEGYPEKLMAKYKKSVSEIHAYLDKGYKL